MPLGTLDRRPPPLFHQGPSALTRLAVFSALALFLMAADTRFALTRPLRAGLAILLVPVERAWQLPVEGVSAMSEYARGLHQAQADLDKAQRQLAAQSAKAAVVSELQAENARLRALIDLRPRLAATSTAAEVLYEASDPFSRKIFIDRGATSHIAPGSPVIDEAGVLGQVTRVYPMSSEVTLLVDKEAAIPVLNVRTHQRSAAFGADGTRMELRFMAGNADVREGDVLQTSGVDGIYPAGLDVARVVRVDRSADSSFARISLAPMASADGVRHVLVLEPMAMQLPARPAPAEAEPASAPKGPRPIKGTKK
jgi:rod shape-determining protein MreC